jgi:hypothetical protein
MKKSAVEIVADQYGVPDDTFMNGCPGGRLRSPGAVGCVGSTRLARSWIVGSRQPRR